MVGAQAFRKLNALKRGDTIGDDSLGFNPLALIQSVVQDVPKIFGPAPAPVPVATQAQAAAYTAMPKPGTTQVVTQPTLSVLDIARQAVQAAEATVEKNVGGYIATTPAGQQGMVQQAMKSLAPFAIPAIAILGLYLVTRRR